MNRQKRLKEVRKFIDVYDRNEAHFELLYYKLLEEFKLELASDSTIKTNYYLDNLRKTRDKQAETYIKARAHRPKKGTAVEFEDFVRNFRHDVMEAIQQ